MLIHRLLFGTLMVVVFPGLILLDGYLDGSLLDSIPDKPVQGILFALLVCILLIPAHLELGNLLRHAGVHIFHEITLPASILLAMGFFFAQFSDTHRFFTMYLLCIPVFSFLLLFFAQSFRFGAEGTIRNVGGNFFSIIYLGLLCSFIVGIRVLYGPWVFLSFALTVKSSDIGAYTIGRLLGKHKMTPTISPGKTWEGLAGGIVFAGAVSFGFAHFSGIMPGLLGICFGAVFGILGQLGDLVESMIKRDAALKDSSSSIPGFGGLLDVLDSPLATAPAAFVFFYVMSYF